MKYMGSKRRIVKEILPLMLKDRLPNQWWVEPFVGGGNVIEKVTGNRLGADVNKDTIEALLLIQNNLSLIPKDNKEFTEEDYEKIKKEKTALSSFASFAYSYGGKFLGGWRRDKVGKRDYVKEAYKNALKQSKLLQGVIFKYSSYETLEIPVESIIYCDPPYKGTTNYKDSFNHNTFWEWCRKKTKEGHKVFISEYQAPDDFISIWEKEICSNLDKDTGGKKGIEKLFIYKED